ncbi:MAG: Fe2+-dependent dioxygenase [Hyphomonadaceae bacterium]
MMLILEAVLGADDVARVRRELQSAPWLSGKRTAGAAARGVKENLQADGADKRVQALEHFVVDALRQHPLFDIAARPQRVSRLLFSRYEPGMTYGAHTDDALMGGGEDKLRTDLAFTIFLADRSTYQGGALVVESPLGEQEIALEAGDAILYPAGTIHQVAPVTEGARLAAVGWVQSVVADTAKREVLFDLSRTRVRLANAGVPREDLLALDKCVSNLLRMWAQP